MRLVHNSASDTNSWCINGKKLCIDALDESKVIAVILTHGMKLFVVKL